MKRFRFKSCWKGLAAVLSIVLVLFILFAAFGRVPDYALDAPQGVVPVRAGNAGAYALKYGAQTQNSAPAFEKDVAGYGGIGFDQNKVNMTFSEAITSEEALPKDRKIIREGSAYIETRDFAQSMASIDRMISQSGGFIEQKNIRGSSYSANDLRRATIVFRVPSHQFETVMDSMGNVGAVIQSSTSGTDITDQYIDYETRLRNLKMQEETLLDILSRAEKLEDVITLESRISEVRYEIESIENKLKNYDRLVQYSRITVELEEVVEITPAAPVARTLGDRLGHAFRTAIESFVDELENFLVWLVYNWILLLLILVLALVVILIVKRRKRKKHAKAAGIVPGSPDDEKPQD